MKRQGIMIVIAAYLLFASAFGLVKLDVDEFGFVKEPYEILGGDYTVEYLKAHEFGHALNCAARSYRFFWTYRPLFSPVIAERDRTLFRAEEMRFGYVRPDSVANKTLAGYKQRLIVPEPDRFYRHGAGQGLLAPLLRLPSLALVRVLSRPGRNLLDLQFQRRYHWLFLVTRLQGLLAGLLCLLVVHHTLSRRGSPDAWLGTAWLAAMPPVLYSFPNLHYDAIMAPLALLAAIFFVRERHVAGGIALGLALAAKNTAVFILPAALAFVAWEVADAHRSGGASAAGAVVRRRGVGLLVFGAFALMSLAPFANPVSQFREILTPVMSRPIDPRGEDVASFGLAARLAAPAPGSGLVAMRPIVSMIRNFTGFNLRLLMLILGLSLVWSRLTSPLNRFGFFFLLLVFPYSVVYGDALSYRSLVFLPFIALIAAEVLGRRMLIVSMACFLALDILLVVDPITATGMLYTATPATSVPSGRVP